MTNRIRSLLSRAAWLLAPATRRIGRDAAPPRTVGCGHVAEGETKNSRVGLYDEASLEGRMYKRDPNRPGREILVTKPSFHKLVDVVLLLLTEADNQTMTTYQIVKSVFLADRAHLNAYGRPITFDVYKAMVNGPVPSAVYDMLVESPSVIRHTGPVCWRKRLIEQPWGPSYEHFAPTRSPDLEDVLSESAIEALRGAYQIVKRLDAGSLRDFTHLDPAYKDAWRDGSEAKSFLMDYALMLDVPDPEIMQELGDYVALCAEAEVHP